MKKIIILTIVFTLSCLFVSASIAEQYKMEETFIAMTPIFMLGHEGNPAKIEGFEIQSNVSSGGQSIGSALLRVKLVAPPMDMTAPISWMNGETTYMFNGIGTIEAHSVGIAYGTSSAAATGEIVISSAGSIRNGTGGLAGFEGVISSSGNVNIFTSTGVVTDIFYIP